MNQHFDQLLANFEGLATSNSDSADDKLRWYLLNRDGDTYEKHIIPYLACRALLQRGEKGIKIMAETLPIAPGNIYPMSILSSLWHSSEGKFPQVMFMKVTESSVLSRKLPKSVSESARNVFFRFIDESRTDPECFDRLINLLYHEQISSSSHREENQDFHRLLFKVIADSSITITDRKIEEFESLIGNFNREEEYQTFLIKNPVFLDPLGSRLIPKHKLGDEYITDYVLEKLTEEYIAVEIEKPSDPIFTKSGNFSHQFTHAFGQVLDFIEWIEQNIAYAQKKLPGISSPNGLLVIGMRTDFTEDQKRKLSRFNRNSSSVVVKTFDDLLSEAKTLNRNLRARVEFRKH
jgi:hypothetical protein